MPKKPFLVDSSLYNIDNVLVDLEKIREYNSQRFEMEQLTAIVYENFDDKTCVGYKDLSDQEFWVRGHMPNFPLMPGVVMCEAAAQLSSYFVGRFNMFNGAVMGFAGMEEVKFRGMVRPGDRLIVQSKMLKCRKFLVTAAFMGIVHEDIVCEGIIKGFPMSNSLESDSFNAEQK
ncbi:MAG: 3-hydroxyacyl-ACP dehydratase FabZ family protein [Planctomycetia bacterium]|nr:3-hydroxyacyl-ACP dehydratase FabZ family protein [Planctomycetia bacterium]